MTETRGILTRQKLLKAQGNISIPIIIISLEDIRHPFQSDARLHEKVKTQCVVATLVISPIQDANEGRGKVVAERRESVREFRERDIS